MRQSPKSVPPLQFTEVVAKRFLRDFYRKRVPKISPNDLTVSSLTLKNCKTVSSLPLDHPFSPLSNTTIVKTSKHFVFSNVNYSCHDENCELSVSRSCCHFVKFVIGDAIKFGLLEKIHYNVAGSNAALTVLEFSYGAYEFPKIVNKDIADNLKKFGNQSFIVQLVDKLERAYVPLSSLVNPCVVYNQSNIAFCMSICQAIELD